MLKKFQLLSVLGFISFFITAQALAAAESLPTIKIGDWEIVALNDVQRAGQASILLGASAQDLKTYLPTGQYPSGISAFLLRAADKNILVDTALGEKLTDNLAALSLKPENIDLILLTHTHLDHIGGLVKDNQAVFPQAKLYVSAKEHEFWRATPDFEKMPEAKREAAKSNFAKSQQILKLYQNQLIIFEPNSLDALKTDLLPGLRAIAAYGHTPGHTVFLAESKGDKFLFWGDLTHASAIQIPKPEVAVTYDTDQAEAVKARLAIFKLVAGETSIPVAGAHIPRPAIGWLKPEPANPGGYAFTYLNE